MVRHCHPIFATFIGDYPEQVLVTGVIYGDCVKCPIPKDQLGEPQPDPGGRSLKTIMDLLDNFDHTGGSYVQFARGCKDAVSSLSWRHFGMALRMPMFTGQ